MRSMVRTCVRMPRAATSRAVHSRTPGSAAAEPASCRAPLVHSSTAQHVPQQSTRQPSPSEQQLGQC